MSGKSRPSDSRKKGVCHRVKCCGGRSNKTRIKSVFEFGNNEFTLVVKVVSGRSGWGGGGGTDNDGGRIQIVELRREKKRRRRGPKPELFDYIMLSFSILFVCNSFSTIQ